MFTDVLFATGFLEEKERFLSIFRQENTHPATPSGTPPHNWRCPIMLFAMTLVPGSGSGFSVLFGVNN